MNGRMIAVIALAAKAQRKRTASSGMLAFFQRAIGPTPIRKAAGTITSKLKENAAMASNTVQLLKPPRFSVTASE